MSHKHVHAGLVIIIGAMSSGKTSYLINAIKSNIESQIKMLVIKSNKDNRFDHLEGKDRIYSRDGNSWPAIPYENLSDVKEELINDAEMIFIDEAQFFSDLEKYCRLWVFENKKRVFISGLHGLSTLEPFGQIHNCICFCEDLIWLKTICQIQDCNNPGAYAKYIKSKETNEKIIDVGSDDKWRTVCITHK